MKVAFTCSGEELSSPLDSRFGRCKNFLVVDLDTGDLQVIKNEQNRNAPQGAGIQAGQAVASSGAEALVTGHCGPKAFQVLNAADVKIYLYEAATVQEALDAFREGKISESKGADVEGHWV